MQGIYVFHARYFSSDPVYGMLEVISNMKKFSWVFIYK